MTIYTRDLYIPEIKAKLKVIKVHQEDHSESTWWLQFEDYPIFTVDEKSWLTKEEHQDLVGKTIECHLCINDYEVEFAKKKEKNLELIDGWLRLTGQIVDDVRCFSKSFDGKEKEYISYKLDSVFELEADGIPEGAKVGDWITIRGEIDLILPKKK